ncbi:MAG: F0F1 ATP synthase subunit B [Gemmatimonadota bacterium]|nr:F0F1 ATP synthase subunit B [Gemmatimonadota bacterium]
MRTRFVAFAVAALTAGVPGSVRAAEEAGTTPLFSVNLGTTVWTAIVFLMLLGILWKFAWGPILAAADAREKGIQDALDEAARRNDEATKLLEEHRRQLSDARRQANELIAEGKAAGERVRKEIEEKARTEGQGIVDRARAEIERERDAAIDALRKESVDLALAAAGKLILENMDQAKDRKLVEKYLDDLAGGTGARA